MSQEILLLAAILVVGISTGVLYPAWRDIRVERTPLSDHVVVNLDSGDAVEGAMVRSNAMYYLVKGATIHSGGDSVVADGTVVIPRRQVDYIQVLGSR